MKQLSFIAIIALLLFAAPIASAAEGQAMATAPATQQQRMLRGNIVDEQGSYISYVTIVAMQNGRQVSGVSSDKTGTAR